MEEAAVANSLMHCYSSPNTLVVNNAEYREEMGEEALAALYPADYNFAENYNQYAFRNLDTATLDYMTALWEDYLLS